MYLKSLFAIASLGLALALPAAAQKKYDAGASDTEIKIGQTMPYSGPASAYGTIGRVQAAYFKMVNEGGGVSGRKINFISLDDGFNPAKTVEVARRLVEQDEVLFLMGTLGSPTNTAIQRYLNTRKVPQLFLSDGAAKWNDPKNFPWSISFNPNYRSEGKLYAADILKNRPNAKIAVLSQNDDLGKDYVKGLLEGLGDKARTMVVAQATYEITDPTIDSQIVTLKASGADTFVDAASARFAAQAIRKVADIGWAPLHYLSQVSSSVGVVLEPAGLDKSTGIISMQYMKDPKSYGTDPDMIEYFAFMKKYYPEGQINDGANIYGYSIAQLTVHVLRQSGDNLTRDNVMKQATSLKNFKLPMTLAGVTISTSPDDFALFQRMQLTRFDGNRWVPVGPPTDVN